MGMCAAIRDLYREDFARVEMTLPCRELSGTKKIFRLTRLHFNVGAVLSILFLVQTIALSIFFLGGVIVTCGQNQNTRASLSKNIREGFIYAGAIPLGCIGVLFPQIINQQILQIPSDGLVLPYKA